MELLLKDEMHGSSFLEKRQGSVFCWGAPLGPSGTSSELTAQNPAVDLQKKFFFTALLALLGMGLGALIGRYPHMIDYIEI